MALLRQLAGGVVDLVYPPACCLCGAEAFRDSLVCAECREDIVDDPFASCPRCGRSVGPHTDTSAGCPGCTAHRFAFEAVWRLGPYEGRRRDLVLRAKYDEQAAECAAALLTEATRTTLRVAGFVRVIPVPLHWRKAWTRGYNQSAVLARTLAAGLGVPFAARSLRRLHPTKPQSSLSPTARRDNVRGAFRGCGRLEGLAVLLVDDVMTTGATADAAARALRQVGASRVGVAVVAHG